MTNIVRLDNFRVQKIPTAASAAVGTIAVHEDGNRFQISFEGGPDEIYDQVVDWLAGQPDNLGDIITVRQGGSLTFEDAPEGEWRGRYDDVIWEETFPMWDMDGADGEPMGVFDAEVLLRLLQDHPRSFKALLAATDTNDERHSTFLVSFYCY
jgi:hypothetical protein